jgi:hypothetical protein
MVKPCPLHNPKEGWKLNELQSPPDEARRQLLEIGETATVDHQYSRAFMRIAVEAAFIRLETSRRWSFPRLRSPTERVPPQSAAAFGRADR